MSTVNMTLGGRQKIATVTATDALGNIIPASQLTITFAVDTPGVITEGSGVGTESQEFLAHAVGSAGVTFSAGYTEAAGGGPAVAAPTDTVVVSVPPVASVSVVWADEP
jgi:hypothetical protein